MTRVLLSSLAAIAVLATGAGHASAREPILPRKPKEIVVVGSRAKAQPKRQGTSYKNGFRCIPGSCPAGGSPATGGRLRSLPPR